MNATSGKTEPRTTQHRPIKLRKTETSNDTTLKTIEYDPTLNSTQHRKTRPRTNELRIRSNIEKTVHVP
jgi:hypothetical protein